MLTYFNEVTPLTACLIILVMCTSFSTCLASCCILALCVHFLYIHVVEVSIKLIAHIFEHVHVVNIIIHSVQFSDGTEVSS